MCISDVSVHTTECLCLSDQTSEGVTRDAGGRCLQVLLHLLVQSILQIGHQHLLVQVLQGLP